jgi:hypothetical protein
VGLPIGHRLADGISEILRFSIKPYGFVSGGRDERFRHELQARCFRFAQSTPFIVNSLRESQSKVAASRCLLGTLEMTRYRIQVWCDVSGDKAYILDSYDTHVEALRAAKKCCAGLPYSFEIEEETAPDYAELVA